MPTPLVILTNAPIACYLAANDIENGNISGKECPDNMLAVKIHMGYKILKKIYDNDPNYDGIVPVANWLWELCGIYGVMAMGISGSGGGSITPITPINPIPSGSGLLRLVITNANLSGNDFNDTRIVGKNIQIFISGYNEEWLYSPANFTMTATGITITAPGFDPSNYQYQIIIQEYVPVSGAIVTLATPVNLVRSFGPGFTQVKYDWDDVPNATAYVWELASDFLHTNVLASGTVTISEVLITLAAVTIPLYFRVYATAPGYAQSGYANAFFTPGKLATPVLGFSGLSSTSFETDWTPDANSNQMSIDIAIDPLFATIVQSATAANTGSWVFNGGVSSTTYYVRVKQKSSPPWFPDSDYGDAVVNTL